ncbi:hypothetical protein [Yoonia sp. 2307UL14-13]|uniref:hypothetical protein n=1 Tax=Yoonia sp. 2307UL14-13 TaxID=3126506 RepID=UPI0030B6478C
MDKRGFAKCCDAAIQEIVKESKTFVSARIGSAAQTPDAISDRESRATQTFFALWLMGEFLAMLGRRRRKNTLALFIYRRKIAYHCFSAESNGQQSSGLTAPKQQVGVTF